jgi:hypothetical protein
MGIKRAGSATLSYLSGLGNLTATTTGTWTVSTVQARGAYFDVWTCTASGTWIPSRDCHGYMLIVGAGGAGSTWGGGGGGGGSVLAASHGFTAGTTYTTTIGAGGARAYRGGAGGGFSSVFEGTGLTSPGYGWLAEGGSFSLNYSQGNSSATYAPAAMTNNAYEANTGAGAQSGGIYGISMAATGYGRWGGGCGSGVSVSNNYSQGMQAKWPCGQGGQSTNVTSAGTGGGGGATAHGLRPASATDVGGNGGAGWTWWLTNATYGGGGGGSAGQSTAGTYSGGSGGAGGGGAGASKTSGTFGSSTNGTANTGGGGGGWAPDGNATSNADGGGNGGSGVVIIAIQWK